MYAGLIDPSEIFVDGTHIKAAANSHKYRKEMVDQQAKFMSEHKEVFAYSAQVACDKHYWALAYTVEVGNVHDS